MADKDFVTRLREVFTEVDIEEAFQAATQIVFEKTAAIQQTRTRNATVRRICTFFRTTTDANGYTTFGRPLNATREARLERDRQRCGTLVETEQVRMATETPDTSQGYDDNDQWGSDGEEASNSSSDNGRNRKLDGDAKSKKRCGIKVYP